MNTTCFKDFTLKVNQGFGPLIVAYWSFEQQESPKQNILDDVTNLSLEPTGPVDVLEAALIGNGLHFSGLFAGDGYITLPTPVLAHVATTSFSLWGWYRVNSTGPADATGGPSISFTTNGKTISIAVGAGAPASNPVHIFSAFDQVYLPVTLGTWHFFHLCWNSYTQMFGYSVDNAVVTWFPTTVALADDASGIVNIQQHFTGMQGDILFDEVGLTLDEMLSAADQAYLYNSGAGRTWPITLP